MVLIPSSRVRVAMYPRVPGKFVGAREALGAAGELASVWLLASVGPDMASLVFKPVKSLFAQRAFVGARKVLAMFI